MDGYISREVLLRDMLYAMAGTGYQTRAMDVVQFAPTADVVEVVHGEWQSRYKKKYKYRCSLCNGDSDLCSDYC